MAKHDAIHCVGMVPIFKGLTNENQQKIATLVHESRLTAGDYINHEGWSGEKLTILASGEVKISQTTPDGHEQLIRMMQPGDFEGETVLFTDGRYSNNAIANLDSQICQISKHDFHRLLMSDNQLMLNVINQLGQRLLVLEKQRVQMLSSVRERVANYLYEMQMQKGTDCFRLPLLKKDLASFLNTTPESISRTLKEFSNQGLIRLEGRQMIEIIDSSALKRIN
ncbi:Crp/Fnr family transcriptional regulator [Weissella diestrammenae]|uniref:Crp/Fnr family transcriptional regulator n=1 Tax=Weissella diestrammenae TaxID=1162633 RepID=A0A7G9T5K0_9LACO|nr:Crp/Fnr family transcriptional regulator [Weissella diestrammenae]MCM0582202.1 Crp/Fnr family transcriptional regulator [Weissella diestrammenae]QNN75375.1 Crp/Fnr family transcriptional regulator [Weissella diestrammenae]